MPLKVPTPTVLEGDYSDWAESWTSDFPQGHTIYGQDWMAISDVYLYIGYRDDSANRRFIVLKLEDGSSMFTSTSGQNYLPAMYANDYAHNNFSSMVIGGVSFSVRDRYNVFVLSDKQQFEVWKNGAKVWTSPLASEVDASSSTYEIIGISWNGLYIIALTDVSKLICFKGS